MSAIARLDLASRASASGGAARLTRLWRAAALVLPAAGAASVSLSTGTSADYSIHYPVSADNAAPAVQALAHGHFGAALAHQPMMGLLSLLLRAPVAWLTGALGGGQMLIYRLGALVCFVPAIALATWILANRRAVGPGAAGGRGQGAALGALVAAGVIVFGSPVTAAVGWGHPEEILTAALVVWSMICAEREHPLAAGLLAGAAIGTKEWAIIAVLPMLLTLKGGHIRALLGTALTGFCFAALPVLLDRAAYARASHALGASHLVTALSAWWPLSFRPRAIPAGAPLAGTLPFALNKTLALGLGLGLATVAALVLSGCALRHGGWLRVRGRTVDAFALLCMLAVVRCIADPGPVEYYYVAAVIPLAAWEALVLRRVPFLALLTVVVTRLLFGQAVHLGAGAESALLLIWSGAMICYLATHAFAVGRAQVCLDPTEG